MMHRLIIVLVTIILAMGAGCCQQKSRADIALERANAAYEQAIESKRQSCIHLDMVASEMNRKLWHEECSKVGVDLL